MAELTAGSSKGIIASRVWMLVLSLVFIIKEQALFNITSSVSVKVTNPNVLRS